MLMRRVWFIVFVFCYKLVRSVLVVVSSKGIDFPMCHLGSTIVDKISRVLGFSSVPSFDVVPFAFAAAYLRYCHIFTCIFGLFVTFCVLLRMFKNCLLISTGRA